MNFQILTLFPEFIESYLSSGVLGRAQAKGLIEVSTINPRDFVEGVHRAIDDRPFGGGDGMVMALAPLVASLNAARKIRPQAKVIYLSPQGRRWNEQQVQATLASGAKDFIFLSARYGGIDQRLFSLFEIEEVSIGDYVLAGGELPALVIMESLARKLPGVLGHEDSAKDDSFVRGWLEAPQFTRPSEFEGLKVPEILGSGHHQNIAMGRQVCSALVTFAKRPDLLLQGWETLSDADRRSFRRKLREMYLAKTDWSQWGIAPELAEQLERRLDELSAPSVKRTRNPIRLAMGLVHYPILDKSRKIVATNITNFDIHDIARAARTYGAERYYLIHPMQDQRMFVERVLDHWRVGEGTKFNASRKEALTNVRTASSVEEAMADWGAPRAALVCTHARAVPGAKDIDYGALRSRLEAGEPIFLLFGTGYGLPDDFMLRCDYLLAPIKSAGKDDFRHLSVRSAVSVILDRLLGA